MKFKITNTTVKPVRKGQNGADLRNATEKVGHAVQFRTGSDLQNSRPKTLLQGQSTLVDTLDPGLLNLQRGGFVRIEPIKDIATALKEHALQKDERSAQKKANAESKRDDSRKARAVEMGKDTYAQDGGAEHDDAVNPDGDPNFLAQASKVTKRKRKGQEVGDASAAGSVGDTAL